VPSVKRLWILNLYEGAQRREVFDVLMQIIGFVCFKAARPLLEPGVVDDVAEGFQADFAFADVFVPVHPRVEIRLGIVEVKGGDLFLSDQRIQLPDGFVPALGGANVVAGGEQMGRVNANGQSFRLLHAIINRRQVFQLVAETTSLTRRIFQRDAHRRILGRVKDLVQPGDNLRQPCLLARAQMRAGMQHEERQPQRRGKVDFLDERLQRFVAVGGGRCAEIDHVTGVAENAGQAQPLPLRRKAFDLFRRRRAPEPLHIILDEDLRAIRIDRFGPFQRRISPASRGTVSAENHKETQSFSGVCNNDATRDSSRPAAPPSSTR
jgi:hypothetical protein